MPSPLADYLADCRARRGTGATTPETSLYPPLETLLNAVGQRLKPKVRCFMSLRDQGAGMPDGGLFTPDQIGRASNEPPAGQSPSRDKSPRRCGSRHSESSPLDAGKEMSFIKITMT
jgi:hypothetical protein